MIRVGSWRVDVLSSGSFALDGGAMFGIVPRPQWAARFPPDDQGRVTLAARCLLLRHDDGRVVLVDAGMGGRWLGRARALYALAEGEGLLGSLASLGVGVEDVTDVLATHLHFDHAGGLVSAGAERKPRPTFPRARVHVQAEHLEWARRPSARDRASFRAADFQPLVEAGLVVEHEGPGEVIEDLEVRLSWGHTPAMMMPLLRPAPGEDGAPLLFPSDLMPTTAHVHPAWIMAYDNHAVRTAEEKGAIVEEAVAEGWVVVPDHDPDVDAFTLRRAGSKLEVEPVAV